jgi:hypothetical protein
MPPFETREYHHEKLYRPDGFRRSYRFGSAVAAMPGAASSSHASAARNDSQPILMTAEMDLPFDRYWSKN